MNDLVTWLRGQIAATKRRATTYASTKDYVLDARDMFAQCQAHTAILDRYERALAAEPAAQWLTYTRGQSRGWLLALEGVVRNIAVAYQHRPGYREEWRP